MLSTLTTSHSTTTETLAKLASERQGLEEKEVGLRKLVAEAETKRTWFEDMSGKTDDLGAFLDAKVSCLLTEACTEV
jgi:GC-rich sequence DNA-binding factor